MTEPEKTAPPRSRRPSGTPIAPEPPLPDGRSLFIRLTDLTGRVSMRVLTHVNVDGLDQPLP